MDFLSYSLLEGVSYKVSVKLLAEDQVTLVPKASLTSVELTLTSVHTGNIINSRSAQSVLDANGGVVSDEGVLSMAFNPLDNAIEDDTLPVESHFALFEWEHNSKIGKHGIYLQVGNLVVAAGAGAAMPSNIYKQEGLTIPAGFIYSINHNLNNADAQLKSFIPYWGPTAIRIAGKTVNSIIVTFSVASPGSEADVEVEG